MARIPLFDEGELLANLSASDDFDRDPLIQLARSLPDRGVDPLLDESWGRPAAQELIPSQPQQPTIDPQQRLYSPDQLPRGALDAFFSPFTRGKLSDAPKVLASGTANLVREVATSPIPTPGTVQEAAIRLMGNVAQKVNPKANLDVVQQLGEQTQVRDAAFQALQQDIQSEMSPQMQASLQKNWVGRDAEGNLTWGDADILTLLGQAGQSIPGVVAGIGAGGGAAQLLRSGTKGLFRRAGLERLARAGNTAAEARLKKIDAILDAAGYGLGETSVAAPLAEQQVRDQVNALDMATLRHSPRFMEIYDAAQELGPEERFLYARETLANELGSATGLKVAATTFAAGPIAGPVAGRARQLLTGRVAEAAAHAARGRAANAGVSALEEMGQEFVQSGAEGALQALALREAGVTGDQADPYLQAANQAVGGAAAGGLIGGGIGYATGRPGGAASATSPAPDAPAAGTAPGSPPGAPPPGGAPEAAAPVDEQVNMATLSALARQAQATEGIDVGAVQQITRAAVRKQITMPEAAQALRDLITDATGTAPETDAGAAGAGQPQAGSEAAVGAETAAAGAGAAQGEPQTAQQPSSIDAAANAAATSPTNGKAEPTEAQKEAGNYAKGHVRVQGLDISIENPRGSVRSGTNKDGRAWKTTMPDHYGYIRGTVGKDKDHIDVTLGPDPENASLPIFVFNQANLETGQFDEHKTFMGYADVDAARAAYRASFSGRLGQRMEKGLLGIAQFTPEQFKAWLADGAHSTPAQSPQGSAADLTPDEAAHSRYPNVAPETAERLAVPGVTEELRRMAPHAGWSETGGRMIRKSDDPDSPDYSTVVGRTKWLPHEPWFAGLSTKLGKDGDYVALVEKALAGEKLTAREQRVIEGMTEAAEQTVRANAISDADLVKLLRRRAEERAASVMSEADIQEYHAHLNDEERAQDEWFRRENESARGEESGPAPDDSGGQGPPAQPPAGEARRGDQADAGNVRRGGREEAPAKVTPRRPERPESQERLEFITGGKKGLEAHILFGRFADGRWGAVSGYQFRTGTMLGRTGPLDDRVPSMADTREEAINGAATILHNWMRGIASNQQADHTPAMREAATALADRLAKQYEIAAPPDAAPAPPAGKAPERDLFGEAPVSKQALADEQRRRDEKRNSGQDSTETGDPSDLFSQARQQTDLTETAAPKAAPRPSKNTIFTEDAAEAARAVLRKKLGQINTGIDPELLNAGITLAGYHIEKGARTFAAFAEAMIADLGEAVRPFLKSWYMAVKYDPRAKPFEKQMDSAGDVEAFDLHEADSAGRPTQTLSPYEQGKAAFLAGKPAAVPTEVITADQTLKAAKEWSRGWQEANLAAPVDTAPESSASETDDAAEAAAVGAAMDALVSRLRGEGFKSIVEARKFLSELTGQPITDADLKYVDEIIETAVVAAARDIAGEGNDPARTFADLVDLYRKQPKLSTRTSTSVAQQAYSTPAPLAFLASRLAGVTSETSVYEPSAGNGMLLIEASPRNTHAVELNPDRAAALQAMGFNPVVGDAMSDATAPDHKQDVVIANPPFGVVRTDSGATRGFTVDVGGDFPSMQTNEIDHAISLHALSYLKDDGRAVLIIGGINKLARTEEARSDAYNGAAKRKFFYHLYRLYNVVDHFTVAGELYERQGAGWPVDVIVIHGRGKSSRDLPAADVPRVYSDWAAMAPLLESGDGQASGLGADAEGTGRVPRGGLVRPDSGAGSRSVSGPARGPDTGAGGRLSQSAGGGRAAAPESVGRGAVSGRGERATGVGGEPTGLEQSGDSRAAGSARGAARPGSEAGGNAGSANADRGGPGRSDGSARGVGRPDGKAPVASEGQSPYEPTSSADSVGTLVPSNMRSAIADSLSALVDRVGPLDEYVARELGYEPSSIGKYFSGEQVDALALALDQMQRGAGFIIGDQTGVGKGRVVAGVIRYALKNGRTPIFVTEKPNLYADMYRDLTDIGMQDIRPLMTNAGEKVPLDDDGKVVLKTPAGKAHSQALEEMASTGDLGAHNIVFTTYSQMQTLKGAETSRMAFLRAIAPNAIVIFDESHNAGGNDSARKNQRQMEADAGSKKTGRAAFARALAGLASGVFYSSATYAKRPSVMDLYFKTDMRMAVGGNVEALPDAIQAGGVPLQQVVASMLARAGQYIRRERSFEGVEYNTAETTVDRPAAEQISAIMLSVKEFDDAKKEAVKALAQAAKREAKQISGDGVTGAAGAESTNFTSIMHNAIDQMLLGLKAERAAELAIEALKRGEKPVITVANTMGSFIEEYAEAAGMKSGDAINLTFGDLLARYLERSRDVRIKSPDGTSSRHRMSDEELGPFALSAYRAAEALVRGAGEIASMPVSPIDWIHARIQAAGYTSGEITGRTHTIDYSSAGGRPIYRSRGSKATSIFGRRKTITDFNSGKLDVVVLNQAGATGLSLHASEKFKDKRRRRMIIAQAEKNIDTHMQMLGRVHRTGQVVAPAYDQLVADVPAEKRPAAVLAKKMASLNANTTASRTSAVTSKDTVDFLNQYGDEVVAQLMADLPDVHRRLGEPLDNDSEGFVTEDAARKVTGRIPLLPVAEQEELYDMIESGYREAIARADAMGENALEAKTLELDAKTTERRTLFEREGDSNSPFADAAYLETVDAKRLGKPYTSEQVRELAAGEAGLGKDAAWDDIKDAAAEKWRRTASDTRDSFQQYRAGLEKAMFDAGAKDVVARARLGVLDGQFDRWKGLADTLTPGETYELQLKNGAVFYGVLLDITRKKGVKMPVANGSWVARFAVADGARQIALPFSKLTTSREDAARPEARVTYVEARAEHPLLGSILKMFDAGQSTSRENRHIVTGNLLAGFSKLPRGQIVHYTDDTGATRQGVLLPRNFDIKEFEAAQPIELPPAAAMKLLKSHPQARVETADGSVRLLADGDGFLLSTPRSKSGGGDVYLDPQVRAITGDFVSVANSMRAGITAEQARRVLPILAEKFGPLQAESHHKEAIAAGGRRAIGNVVPPDSTDSTQVRENAAVYEGEAAKDPKVRARRRKVAASRPAKAGRGNVQPAGPVQIDIFANDALPLQGQQAARTFDRVALVETGRFKTGITTIDEWTAAAHIIAPLRKIPQEQFLMLAIDKRRRPLAVLRHTVGLRDSSNVDPGTVFGHIASVPNVAKVYFAHNHPSGVIEQSEADHLITDHLNALMRGSGIEVGGMIVVAPGSRKASLYTPGTYGDLDQRIQPAVRKESVPMLERRFTRIQPDKFIVRSSAYVKEAIERFASRMESGLLFLNGRHHVVGVLPTSVAEMGRLRTDDPRTSHARLFAEASKANASAAIAVVPEGEESVNAARNAMTALAAGNIRDLDIAQRGANGSLRMASDRSERITNDAFYSRAGATPAAGASVTQVKEWLSAAIEKTRGAANTHVVADVAALREATGDPSIPDDVEGVYFDGESRIYLVASALPTREEALRKYTHEMFGHLALEQYGDIDRAVRMVRNMRRMGSKSIGALWQEVALTQPGLDPVRHAKEVIALMAERGVKNSMLDRLLAWARDLLRSWGVDIEYSDAEVRALIARAARALQEAARISGADRVRAAKIDAAATEEAALRQLNAMDLADSPLIGSGAPLDAYYTRPAVLDKETLGETDIEALDDAIAAALFETPGPDRERLYSRRAPEDPEITRIRRHVMANAAHEGLPLKDRMRLFITRVTDISGLAMRQAIVNKFQSIAAYERLMNAGKLLDAALSPYKQTVATQNLGSVMSAILHKGIPAWVNGAYTVANDGRKGILEIFAPLVNHPDGNLLPQWELYAAARRASRLIEEGRERLFTQEMIDRSLELEQKYPIFKDVFDDWQTFNTQTLDMAQEAGLIDPEARAIWERHDYVPFYRAMESVSGRVNAVSLKKSIANQRARIRTLFGGTSPLEDVFESMLMNTAHLVDASFKNRAAQAIVTAFDGVATTRLPKVVQPTTISADQAMRALRAAGVNLVGQEPSSDYLTLFRRVAPVGKNIVSVMFDGKPQYFEVHDPLLLQSIVEMSPNEWLRQIDLFTFGLLSGSKRLLTRAVTAMPGFIMANYLRDTASNVVQNQNKSVGDMLKLTFITESLKGAVAYIADNPVVAEMMMSGAGGDQVYDNERGNLKRTLMREMSDSAARTRLEEMAGTMVSPRRLWKVYTKVQQASENANRIATYRLVRERGGTHAEAAYQAHDVLNFQQRGAHPAMQLLVMMVPFLNARIQGLDRLARGFTANRMGFMFKGLMLTAVTIALMGLGDDDERYRELPQWDRDANWHLFLGKLHLRIPKPFEVGALFGTVPERMIRLMRGQDRFRDVAQSLVRMVTDTFAFNPVPQAFKPVLEAWAGRSFFTNRPILSIAERNLLPEAQYRPWTSPTLISIAQAMPDAAPAFMRSPLQLEHLIRGYLGGMGMMALEVADRSVRAAGGYYDAPSQSPVDVMLRRFARTGEPRVTRWHDELYRMMDAADEAARTVSKLQGERLFEQAREVAKENRQALLLRPKLNHLAKRMRELNAQLRRVQGSRTLTGDQKRAEIERLNAARNDIARQVEPYAGLF